MMTNLVASERPTAITFVAVLVWLCVFRHAHSEGVAADEKQALSDNSLSVKALDANAGQTFSLAPPASESGATGLESIIANDEIVASDRFWMISTRSISSSACRIDLQSPEFNVYQLECSGRSSPASLDHYFDSLGQERSAVVYVHGNRLRADEAIRRGFAVYRSISPYRDSRPVDWVIWSWPSAQQGILIKDARRKASRTDAQGLYLGWLLRKHVEMKVPTTMVGFSFGGRIITGALHSLAGGELGGRQLPGPPTTGVPFDAGLVAPAIDSHWLAQSGYHSLATKNLDRLVLLYNRRDIVLKRYWLLDRVRGRMALGYSGPRVFAPRVDGTKLSIVARDCSTSIGCHHVELDYYRKSCYAGSIMANLIDDIDTTH